MPARPERRAEVDAKYRESHPEVDLTDNQRRMLLDLETNDRVQMFNYVGVKITALQRRGYIVRRRSRLELTALGKEVVQKIRAREAKK